jgi:hypothetical protein
LIKEIDDHDKYVIILMRRVIMLFMEPSLISRYHPSPGEGRGVKKTYPCLGGNILMERQ